MENTLTTNLSTLVYLFADQFCEPASGLLLQGAIAPRTGRRVNAKTLATNLYLSALLELVETGGIGLEATRYSSAEPALALILLREPVEPISGLAWQILSTLREAQTPGQRRVRAVVTRVIGGPASTRYPWLVALSWSIGEAEAYGYIRRSRGEPGSLNRAFDPAESLTGARAIASSVEPLEAGLLFAQSRLCVFEQRLGEKAELLREEIAQGIEACGRE